MDDPRSRTLIGVKSLTELLASGTKVVVLDVIDESGALPEDRPCIPGALSAVLATDFSGPSTTPDAGKRPLPSIASLEATAHRFGIDPGTHVVVYDTTGGAQASRAWWTLRWAGHQNVRILDGGLKAWTAHGNPVSAELKTAALAPGCVTLSAGHMPVICADEAAALARSGVLLDARGKANYVGEPGKPGTGHIPGARLAPAPENLADGLFRACEDLRARFAALGADGSATVGVYCGSGNAAAHAIAALSAAGIEAAFYPGSWSAWSTDPDRPAATGSEPG